MTARAFSLTGFRRDANHIKGFPPASQATAGPCQCDLRHIDKTLAGPAVIWY